MVVLSPGNEVAVQELAAWRLAGGEFMAALERMREDFRLALSAIEPCRPDVREITILLPAARTKAEAAGDSAFREMLMALLPAYHWDVIDG